MLECYRCKAVDKGSFTMQHESSNNELVAGQCWKFHANSAVGKSTATAAAAVSNARLTAQSFLCFHHKIVSTVSVQHSGNRNDMIFRLYKV